MSSQKTHSVARGAAAAALSFALVAGQFPCTAWAEAAQATPGEPAVEQVESSQDANAQGGEGAVAESPEGIAGKKGEAPVTAATPAQGAAPAVPAASPASGALTVASAAVEPSTLKIADEQGSETAISSGIAVGANLRANVYSLEEDEWGLDEEEAAPESAYADYAFQWYRGTVRKTMYGGSYDSYVPIDGATARTYAATDADAGFYLACKVTFAGTGGSSKEVWSTYATGQVTDGKAELSGVSAAGTAKVGETVSADAFVATSWGGTKSVGSDASVGYQWLAAGLADGNYLPIAGATGRTLTIGSDLVGKYLRVSAESRNVVESATLGPVAARGSEEDEALLADAVSALQGVGYSGYCPSPAYGADSNANDMVSAELASLDGRFAGVTVVTESVAHTADPDPKQRGGIDTGSEHNGDVTFFSLSPSDKTVSTDYSALRQIKPTFRLGYGTATAWYTPGRWVQLDWDKEAMSQELSEAADGMGLSLAQGDSAAAVTQGFSLPNKLADGVKVEWSSSDKDALALSGYSWDDETKATPRASSEDRPVTLTAIVSYSRYGMPDVSVTRDFQLTVKGDPQLSQHRLAEVQQLLDQNYAYASLSYSNSSDGAFDPQSVAGDIQLPTTRTLGTRSLDFDVKVSYQASNQAVTISGYRANVWRPLAGASDQTVDITCTVALRDDPSSSVSKTLSLTLRPLSLGALDDELSLMDEVAAAYPERLLGGQDPAAVTSDLHPFMEGYLDGLGRVGWASSRSAADGVSGIVAYDLADYDPMGSSDQGRTFASSNSSVVSNETLRVTRPAYNTSVTVRSNLRSKRYGAYYDRYKDDPQLSDALKAKLKTLAGREVKTVLTVLGTTEKESPDVAATASVVGIDSFGAPEVWASAEDYSLPAGSTVADLTKAMLEKAGLSYVSYDTAYGFYLDSVTSLTTGKTYGYDATTGKYWQLFVNGKASDLGADAVKLTDGMSVSWVYSAYGEQPSDQNKVTASVKVVGPNASGSDTSWVGQSEVSVPEGTTAAELTKIALERNGMTCDEGMYTISSREAGQTLPNGTQSLGAAQAADGNWSWWQFYINGELSSEYASSYVVKPGDRIEWCYGAYGSGLPQGDVTVDPSAPRPDFQAEWGAYKGSDGSGTSAADTPTTGSSLAWARDLVASGMATWMSDPIVVNGDVYVAAGSKLQIRDAATGAIKSQADLAERVESTCRLAYADGLVIVPLHDGRVQALTADKLVTVWLTDALPQSGGVSQQSISTPLVRDGYYYLGTTAASFTGSSLGGYLMSINLATGSVRWSVESEGSGYYWSGAASVRAGILVADDTGVLALRDASTGKIVSKLVLGSPSRSGVVTSADGSEAYVVTTDGVLHKVSVAVDGTLAPVGSVRFAQASTSTPTLSDGKVYVGGGSSRVGGTGGLYVIDAKTLSVEQSVTATADGAIAGDVKSAPLVARRGAGTYVYFTSNARPGGIYVYKLGEKCATLLFRPETTRQNYAMSSVVAAADGSLYYVNDSGSLFKVVAGSELPGPSVEPGNGAGTTDGAAGDAERGGATESPHGVTNGAVGPLHAARGELSLASDAPASGRGALLGGGLLDASESGLLGGQLGEGLLTSESSADDDQGIADDATPLAGLAKLPAWPLAGVCVGVAAVAFSLLGFGKGKED